MVALVSAVSIAVYILSLIKLDKLYLEQQSSFLIIYLVGLTIIGELDVLLPIYFVMSLLPFVKYIRRISISTALLFAYFGLYLLYGITCQSITGTLVAFIAKMWQFIVFFVVYDSNITMHEENNKKVIWLACITETLLGFYLLATSTNFDANGLARLVSNAQPITGNISTVVLPISVYYYFENNGDRKKTGWLLTVSVVMLVWIVLSGTRGYTLEFAATMLLIFYDYFTNKKIGGTSQRNRVLTITALAILMFVLVVAVPTALEQLGSVLRLKSSVGIRTFENAAVKEFIVNAPVSTVLLGIGLGGQGGKNTAMREALYKQISLGMWNRKHYLSDSGALFHNFYANVLMCLGVVGIAVIICANISMWKRITKSCSSQVQIRRILHLFQLSFLLMNYYRWSAVCGISEMIVFALILKLLEKKQSIR